MFLFAYPGGAEWMIILVGLAYSAGLIVLTGTIWKRPDLDQNSKLLWTIFIFLAPIIAIIIYALYGRQHRKIY